MKDKTTEEVLEALTTVRVDMLDVDATRLFEVIMKVIDERDELKERIEKAIKLHNEFAIKSPLLIFENDDLLKFMNSLLDILKANDNK